MVKVTAIYTYYPHKWLEYLNEARWRVTLEPEELGDVAAD